MNIRKKGKWSGGETKFVIEDNGKYIETLPRVQDLLKLLRLNNPSCEPKGKKKDIEEKPSKSSLNNDYTNTENKTENEPTEEEIEKSLEEIGVKK